MDGEFKVTLLWKHTLDDSTVIVDGAEIQGECPVGQEQYIMTAIQQLASDNGWRLYPIKNIFDH